MPEYIPHGGLRRAADANAVTVDEKLSIIARASDKDRGARDRGPDGDGGQSAGAVLVVALVAQVGSFGEAFVLLKQPARW